MKRLRYVVIIFIFINSASTQAQILGGGGEANPNLKTNLKALEAWQDMKFGLFIHWGPVTLRGVEIGWSRGQVVPIAEYDNLYKEFNPALFDANEWVSVAKQTGMKYLVITAKHHDGFCLWDSDYTDYDIMSSPFKRDILKELADECKQQGILFGTYYSIADWHHPHYTTRYGGDPRPVEQSDMSIYVEYIKNQIRELIEYYDTNIFWFDGYWEDAWTHQYGMDLYKYIRDLKDDVLINNRVDRGRSDENGMTESLAFAGDFGTPEQKIGTFHPVSPWESCITICNQWSWKPNDQMKTLRECIQTLARTVGGGGNLLLNVGPMLDGRIEQRQIDRLQQIGHWLESYGESIYSAECGPFLPTPWMVSTHKDNRIFVHLFSSPEKELILPSLGKHKVRAVKFLNGEPLSFRQLKDRIVIQLPETLIDENDTVVELKLDRSANSLVPLEVPVNEIRGKAGAVINLKTTTSPQYPGKGVVSLIDNERGSRYLKDGNWLGFEASDFDVEIDLGAVKSISTIGIGCLQNQNSWIFLPISVEAAVSADGKIFTEVGNITLDADQPNSVVETRDITFSLKDVQARYIRLKATSIKVCPDWHKGSGDKAWLFVDEIIIE